MELKLSGKPFFQEKYLPTDCSPIGLSALADALNVHAPLRRPACVSAHRAKQGVQEAAEWRIFDSKYQVEPTVAAHLSFAIRHEPIDLLALKRIFQALPVEIMSDFVRSAPTGPVTRRLWCLYEFLLDTKLPVNDCGKVRSVDLIDRTAYFSSAGTVSPRHKINNNLLGNSEFCPVVRRTPKLQQMISLQLAQRTQQLLSEVSPELLTRAASFLLLADSQASFAIEGERLPINKEERWLRAVQQVGQHPLSIYELDRLHEIVIEDRRYVGSGFRKEGVFIGTRTSDGTPRPEFIGARPEDVQVLIDGLIRCSNDLLQADIDPVSHAAITAFGFVYIHPYLDGNGRLHRCLIHQVLAERKFEARGVIFPVSSVMAKHIERYREVLRNRTRPLMPYINWAPTLSGNIEVINETADLYRYMDFTAEAEFLYDCVLETIEVEIPQELRYLRQHDRAMQQIQNYIDLPNRVAESFIMFMRQNNWQLPKKRREKEFAQLTDSEVEQISTMVRDAFEVSFATDKIT
jgi:hypothetical protein